MYTLTMKSRLVKRNGLLPGLGATGSRRGALWGQTCTGAALSFSRQCFSSATRPLCSSFSYRKRRLSSEDAVDALSKSTTIDKGALHVVSVPIGNLKDFSFRALDILHGVDYIVTSDRPATKTLLDLVNIPSQGRLIHFSRSNQTATCEKLVELLQGGRSMALVTTSGTPCVGDVGASLVRDMQASGVRVTAVPGPSAVVTALALCGVAGSRFDPESFTERRPGLHSDGSASTGGSGASSGVLSKQALDTMRDGSFFFGNLLPSSPGERLRLLRRVVATAQFPCVFYEVPRRLVETLRDIATVVPDRKVYVCHELTKMNESLHADTAGKLSAFYLRQEAQMLIKRGEVTVVIAGAGPEELASWMEREAEKRRRLRRSIPELMGKAAVSSTAECASPPPGAKKRKKLTRRQLRKALLKRKRERLIKEIEIEQQRLRLTMKTGLTGTKTY